MFQEDGTHLHTARETIEFLREIFSKRLVSLSLWALRSPDLTPFDFFLWTRFKNKVFEQPPANMAANSSGNWCNHSSPASTSLPEHHQAVKVVRGGQGRPFPTPVVFLDILYDLSLSLQYSLQGLHFNWATL